MIYLSLFITFFKIGLFTFGGGYAMLTMIQQEVIGHNWMSLNEITDFVAVSESTPGPLAINMATFIGMHTGGFLGALSATLGVVLPSFMVIMIIAGFYKKFKENRYVNFAMAGIKAAVVGLIAAALLTTVKASYGISGLFDEEGAFIASQINAGFIADALVLTVMAVLVYVLRKKVHPILLIIACAIIGVIYGVIKG